jgi:hypothetical protein
MAYFANGCEGEIFDMECCKCKFGQGPCPIALVQNVHNYEAVGNPVATEILNSLIKQNGECTMLRTFWNELKAEQE